MPYSDSSKGSQAHVGNLASQSVSRRPRSWGKMSAVLQTSTSATTHWRVVDEFVYLGSTISSNLSLDTELNARIGKASTAMARLATRVWDNSMLTTNTKMKVYQACVLSTLLYSSETRTLYSRQKTQTKHLSSALPQADSGHLLARPRPKQASLGSSRNTERVCHPITEMPALARSCPAHAGW